MSTQLLADRCAELGSPIPRSVLANLEGGRRDAISVSEVLALGAALRVPPLLLAFPLDRPDVVEPLPGVEASPWHSVLWAIGEKSETQTPMAEYYGKGRSLVRLFRQHDSGLSTLFTLRNELIAQRELLAGLEAGVALELVDEDGVEHQVDEHEVRETLRLTEVRETRVRDQVVNSRRLIREQGATPPASSTSILLGPWPDEQEEAAT